MISVLVSPAMNELGAFALALVSVGAVAVVAIAIFHWGRRQ